MSRYKLGSPFEGGTPASSTDESILDETSEDDHIEDSTVEQRNPEIVVIGRQSEIEPNCDSQCEDPSESSGTSEDSRPLLKVESASRAPDIPPSLSLEEEEELARCLTIQRETIGTWQDLASKLVNFDRWINPHKKKRYLYPDIGPPPLNHTRVNVSGTVFDLPTAWIDRFPDSLFCSPDMAKLYNPTLGVYFFDRNRIAFEHILQYMASNKALYQFPEFLPSELMEMELEYYRIGWRFVVGSLRSQPVAQYLDFATFREKAFAFFNYPEGGRAAKIYMYIDLFFILLSILEFIMGNEPEVKKMIETSDDLQTAFTASKWLCLVFFTVDIIVRTIFSLDRLKFLLDYTTWFDILSLLPFYVDIFHILPGGESGGYIQLLKMARISRCLKIIRRSETLLMIINILVGCSAELLLLGVVWLLGVIVSGTLLYFAENQIPITVFNDSRANYYNTSRTHPNGTVYYEEVEWFYSILESCWQAVVVIGTVGYGNVYPRYAFGKFVTSFIIFLSSLLMAIPMTIIIKRFSMAYEQRAQETRIRKVFGGKFTSANEHVVTMEDRRVTTKQKQTAKCIERYRTHQTIYQDIIRRFSKKNESAKKCDQ